MTTKPQTHTSPIRMIRDLATVLAAASAIALAAAGGAEASTYTASECADGGHDVHPNLVFVDPNGVQPKYTPLDLCGTGYRLYSISNIGNSQQGEYANHFYDAPAGTVIRRAVLDVALSESDGYKAVLFEKRVGQPQSQLFKGDLSLRTHDSGWHDQDYVGVGIFCGRASGCGQNQGSNEKAAAASGRATFYMRDTAAPTASPLTGSLTGGGWKRGGGHAVGLSGNDAGAGIEWTAISVNGALVHLQDHCNPTQADGATSAMAPCAGSRSITKSGLDTSAAPFREGVNTITGCVTEFGDSPANGCKTISVDVDNVAPPTPSGLQVAQGSAWQKLNDFDLSWTNPNQEYAPIDGAYVKVSGPGGTVEQFHPGANRQALDNLQVPGDVPGTYTVEVYLRDAAGNFNAANKVSTQVRFDDVPPEESLPGKANGWLGRAELDLGYEQMWDRPLDPHPISGIKGYAFVADRAPSTDPCDVAGVGGANVECSDAEVSFPGIDNRATTLERDDFEEGNNWVHVVPVSGSKVKAEEIEHTRLQVDTIDPVTELGGAPSGWSRSPVNLSASATDDRSGMVDNDDYPDDAPPAAFLQIDGVEQSEPNANLSGTVSGDGVHEVKFWARDLAGNTAAKRSAQVKIDGSAPAAFLERADPDDPELIAGQVADELSGVADARIHYREGNKQWVELDSTLRGGRITARMDSTQMKEGESYLFRVSATDAAGNEVSSSKLENGDRRAHVGPLRAATAITGLTVNGKPKTAKLGYGKRAQLSGRLLDGNGKGVAEAAVEIVESYQPGSKRSRNVIAARTNGQGAFTAALPKGPGRSVSARFAGNRRLLASAGRGTPRIVVRGKVTLSATKRRVGPGKVVRFKGRIGRRGVRIPAGGKLVEVQVRVGRRWKSLDKAIRTNGNGRFVMRYRFGRFYTAPTRFRFRAVVLKEAGFPYRPAKSKPRSVTVVP